MPRRRIRDLPKFARPREKLVGRGPKALSDAELLAVLLRTGVEGRSAVELARRLLEKAGRSLPRWRVEDFMSVPGIGKAKACQIVAAFELARRYLLGERPKIRKPQDILPYVQPYIRRKQEYFVCITLNGAGEVIETRVVTVGLLDSAQIHPREVFADALADRAAGVILVHNHPSGNLEPSPEDIAITRRLVEAGKLLGIEVLDHIIISPSGHLSLKERGIF